jgi:arylsulfatase
MIPRLTATTETIRPRAGRRPAFAGAAAFGALALTLGAIGLGGCSGDRAHWTELKGAPPSGAPSGTAPDILVVLVDALRADHLSCYGYPRGTSPSLDRWAGGAALFTQAYTQGTHTRMSIASLFTGSRPTVHRIREVDLPADKHPMSAGATTDALSSRFTTLAESLSGAGYETWGFSANPHVSSELGFDQGFAEFHETSSRGGSVMVDRFLDEWRDRPAPSGRRPLFAYLHLMSVHNPYDPPRPYSTSFEAPRDGRVVYTNGLAPHVTPDDLAATIASYDGGILYTDSLLERLFSRWEAPGGRPRVIVVLSDHGEEFLDHGGLGHGTTAYSELARIVLIVKAPGVGAGRFDAPVTMLDVHRLLLDLAGAPAPPHAQGRPASSWSLAEDPARVLYTESRTGWTSFRAEGRTLLFPLEDFTRAVWFDAAADPREQNPRRDAATLEAMRIELERALAGDEALAVSLGTPDRRPLRPETIEALKGLGYAGG